MKLLRSILVGSFALASLLGVACSSESKATGGTSSDKICTAGAYVYCRCANRDEGTKLCHDDGKGFDKCEPCESDGNPEDSSYEGGYVPDDKTPVDQDSGPVGGKCGDKLVTEGEECDDGNTDDTDGCDQNCKLAGSDALSSRSCPGMAVHVFAAPVQFTTTTLGAPNTTSVTTACPSAAGNNPTTGAAASDRIFAVTAHRTGLMTVSTSDTNFDNWIYVVSGACTAGAQASYLGCSNKVAGAGAESLQVPVEAGKTYSVVIDGVLTSQGAFRVKMQIE